MNFKNINSKVIISILILLLLIVGGYGIDYAFFKPTAINRYIASNIYKTPANTSFLSDNFYQCVVDSYNLENGVSLGYTTSLSDEQLMSITSLSCSYRDVDDASGIDKLTNLSSLDLSGNQLKQLDISKNLKLKELNVQNNSLTSIDVSSHSLLTSLDLSSNELANLDIHNNINLVELDVSSNGLTALDISYNSALILLDVSDNQLASLDVSHNTKLEDLSVITNQLKSLNIDNLISLVNLSVSDNQLTSLDVHLNTKLENLLLQDNQLSVLDISENKQLKMLVVSSNSLTSLDIQKNTLLESLDASDNQLSTFLSDNNTQLTDLNLEDNQLEFLDVTTVSGLVNLSVFNNQLKSLDLSQNHLLETLNASSNQLTSFQINGGGRLVDLVLDDNQLTSLDLQSNVGLEYLSVHDNFLKELDLSQNVSLIRLNVSFNQLESLDVRQNTDLESLAIDDNELTSLDIGSNIHLLSLNASSNHLTTLDLHQNTELESLFVDDNELTVLDVGENIQLLSLNASSNQLKKLDVRKNTDIASLNVSDTSLNTLDLSQNTKLVSLDLSNNLFSLDLGVFLLGEAIEKDSLINLVQLPSHFTYDVSFEFSSGLTERDLDIVSTEAGVQTVNKINTFSSDSYLETYTVCIVDVKSDKYLIDKNSDYLIVGGESNDEILGNIVVENGTALIEDDKLLIKSGEKVVKEFRLIRLRSRKYDMSKSYIYVGQDSNEVIMNNIEANADIFIDDNRDILSISYYNNVVMNYRLIRLRTKYDLSNHYLYTLDDNILDNIESSNYVRIEDNRLVVRGGADEILDVFPILTLTSDDYTITDDYIYTKYNDFDLDKIHLVNVDGVVEDNYLNISYQGKTLQKLPIYQIQSNRVIRFRDKNLYIKDSMDYTNFLNHVIFNTTNELLKAEVYRGENKVTTGNVMEGDTLEVFYQGKEIDRYTILLAQDVITYQEGADVLLTDTYGVDILKNLRINDTFLEVKKLIETDGVISIKDKDNQVLEDSHLIRTGDRMEVSFASANPYLIYLSIRGDVTGSGSISDEDVLKSYQILRGEKVDRYIEASSDVVGDGVIKINDVAKLHQYVNKKIKSLED